MPELPEVETVKAVLAPFVENKRIVHVQLVRAKNIDGDPEQFVLLLTGETILHLGRKGKYLLFFLSHDRVMISHLRMEGKYFTARVGDPLTKFDLVAFDFSDGTSLRYNDVRKFGRLKLTTLDRYLVEPPLSLLGKEPFDLSPEELYSGLQKKKRTTIKEALLDQHLILGLGNIYDDEVLFAAKLSPFLPAQELQLADCEKIIDESRRILKEAIALGGSTIRSYHPEKGVDGAMQNELLAYGRDGKPCSRCSFPLKRSLIGGRGTVFCPRCQHLVGTPYLVGVTGPIASGKSSVSRYLEEKKGYVRIDADAIVAELYLRPAILKQIQRRFGLALVKDGTLDRAALLTLVSADPKKQKALEKMLHPLVYREIEKRLRCLAERKVVMDIPLLLQSPFMERCDLILYIEAKEPTQIARLVERGKDPAKSLALNASYPRSAAKKAAGVILDGNGSEAELDKTLARLSYL